MHFSSFLLLLLGVMHGCIAALVLRSQPLNHTGGGCPDQNRISIGGSVTSGILLQSLPNFSIDIENYSEEMYTSQCTAYVNITFSEPGHLIDLNTDGGNMSGWLYKNSDSWDTHLKITYEWVGQTGQSSIDEDMNGRFRGKFENRPIGVNNNAASVQSACGGGILKAVYRLKMNVPQTPRPEPGIELPLGSTWYFYTPMKVSSC